MLVVGKYRTKIGNEDYHKLYDIDSDGDVDILDIMKVVGKFGWQCP